MRANNTNPKNASFFSFFSNTPDDTEQSGRFLVMHLQDSNKVFKSSEDVVKSTKQYIKAPQTYQELLDSVKLFYIFSRVSMAQKVNLPKNAKPPSKPLIETPPLSRAVATKTTLLLPPSSIRWTRGTSST
jgi:hypothetical protein